MLQYLYGSSYSFVCFLFQVCIHLICHLINVVSFVLLVFGMCIFQVCNWYDVSWSKFLVVVFCVCFLLIIATGLLNCLASKSVTDMIWADQDGCVWVFFFSVWLLQQDYWHMYPPSWPILSCLSVSYCCISSKFATDDNFPGLSVLFCCFFVFLFFFCPKYASWWMSGIHYLPCWSWFSVIDATVVDQLWSCVANRMEG